MRRSVRLDCPRRSVVRRRCYALRSARSASAMGQGGRALRRLRAAGQRTIAERSVRPGSRRYLAVERVERQVSDIVLAKSCWWI